MVICDLFVIHNLLCMNWYVIHILHGECVESQLYEVGQGYVPYLPSETCCRYGDK